MQCMKYSKIWLNLTFAALNLSFIRGQKAFQVFYADQVIIRLPCGQGQLSRIWKVQCDWLSLGKECCLRLSRRLWGGMKNELLWKRLCGRLDGIMIFPVSIMTKTDLDLHHIHWPDITFDDGQCCISNSSREKKNVLRYNDMSQSQHKWAKYIVFTKLYKSCNV